MRISQTQILSAIAMGLASYSLTSETTSTLKNITLQARLYGTMNCDGTNVRAMILKCPVP